MSEKPILFSGPMVQAILDGTKTQTRRIIKPQPPPVQFPIQEIITHNGIDWFLRGPNVSMMLNSKCPYGKAGDRLWVRENLLLKREKNTPYFDILYQANNCHYEGNHDNDEWFMNYQCWYSLGKSKQIITSIHMPRWASRITLEIAAIRVERLQEITYDDCKTEGIEVFIKEGKYPKEIPDGYCSAEKRCFRWLWDSINLKRGYGWDSNPYVWVVEFKKA